MKNKKYILLPIIVFALVSCKKTPDNSACNIISVESSLSNSTLVIDSSSNDSSVNSNDSSSTSTTIESSSQINSNPSNESNSTSSSDGWLPEI